MRHVLIAGLVCVMHVPALAETEEVCLARWRIADVDGNGALEANLDTKEYVAALSASKPISRDEFLKRCKGGELATLKPPQNPAESKDLGKGDITKGPALTKEDALKKLKASGFGDVTDLALDSKGVWRGTGVANGKDVPVAIDPQGDIVAN